MSRVITIILYLILALAVLVLGIGIGFYYGAQNPALLSSVGADTALQKTVNSLASKVVPSIVAYGQVASISGRNIVLNYSGDSVAVKIADNAQIYSFSSGSSPASAQQKTDFKSIKVGDNLNVNLKVLANGNIEGQSVFILPAFTSEK